MSKKKVTPIKKREYVDPRLAKATVILRDMLNSFRLQTTPSLGLKPG